MQKKIIELAPLPSDWGDIFVVATITTSEQQNIIEWKTQYPSDMPHTKQQEITSIIGSYMQHQHEELIHLFGD